MIYTFGREISMDFTNGESVEAIYCEGVKVWPAITPEPEPGEHYIKWWPKSASGSFIMYEEAHWLQEYSGYYSGPFQSHTQESTGTRYWTDKSAFKDVSTIQVVETNLDVLDNRAFEGCTSLSYFMASQCVYVSARAFHDCSSLISVYLPSCSIISEGAFWSCVNLRDVYLPNLVAANGWFNFGGCFHLPEITLPKCRFLGNETFIVCSDLSYVDLPVCS